MSGIRIRLTPAVIDALRGRLQQALDEQTAFYALVLATGDGRRLVSCARQAVDEGRIAALSSTLLSMATAATKELHGSSPHECIVLFDSGSACFSRIGFEGRFLLCAAAVSTINLGMLISHSRRMAPDLNALLDQLIEKA